MRQLLVVLIAVSCMHTNAQKYEPKGDEGALNIVGNSEMVATLNTGTDSMRISGRMSVNLATSSSDFKEGIVRVVGWNAAFFSVPQKIISNAEKMAHEQGFVGFAATGKNQLRYDARSRTLKGEIKGYVDTSYLSTIVKRPRISKQQKFEEDLFETLTQPAVLTVEVQLRSDLGAGKEVANQIVGITRATLSVEPTSYEKYRLPAYKIDFKDFELEYDIGRWRWFESARNLCVQPVRIARFSFSRGRWGMPIFNFLQTGAGLPFGQPGVKLQWDKADVTFTYREWKTLYKSSYWVTSDAGSEEAELRAEVDHDDCIEVFFVNDFDPVAAHGGGAAWGGGTAGSKIITSDANARNGVDFTHLAHELGHVIGLHHPWESATANLQPATTGTLMCGSGFNNDNPTINSQENKDLVANPLLTFSLKLRTPGPDCQNDADCGACP